MLRDMDVLRTPDERFADLPDYPFAPNYVEVADGDGGTLRVHYLDEGPADADPVLLLHGEPSWSFLYRHMVPPLVEAGHRVIVPDQPGFGRSDKPAEQSDYTYSRFVDWMSELIFDRLDLRNITFFGQDWGGLIGLRLVAAEPDRYARVVVSNTALPTGEIAPSEAFLQWQHFSQTAPEFPIGTIINGGSASDLAADVIAGYDTPFPDDTYKAGARIWPSLVPTAVDQDGAADNRDAWSVLAEFTKPWLCCFGDSDPVTAGGDALFIDRIPGAQGQDHVTVEGGGHFIQEDKGPELAAIINQFIAANPI